MRDYNAYIIPSCVFVGFAIHDLFIAILLLGAKARKAGSTILWKVALITWILILAFVVCQVVVLDYYASPYYTTISFVAFMVGINYVTHFLATIGITAMMVVRVRLFYGAKSSFYRLMAVFGVLVVLFKGIACTIGTLVCLHVSNGDYAHFTYDPLYTDIALSFAVALPIEGVFAVSGTLSFLYFLTDFKGFNNKEIRKDKKFQSEGLRLLVIFALNIAVAILAICVAIEDMYIDHVSFFIPSCIYALEFHAFLDLSYNNAKEMLATTRSSEKKEKSTNLVNRHTSNSRANQTFDSHDEQPNVFQAAGYSASYEFKSRNPHSEYKPQLYHAPINSMPPKQNPTVEYF
ncbi:hypothetical protein HK103_001017 [Boothiomyces macroporosus]|uniref:Uncharacterized protein n=1 Tax=Boothiomyces macroporosus TaxID=261099 RepID=A0AAD5Y162_9FUNG|nr:hypothetical protein HK103_001017 [Boothiomyces macroporosus]